MSRISKPTNKAMVFDPFTGKMQEAATTDISEMERRAKVELKEKEARLKARKEK